MHLTPFQPPAYLRPAVVQTLLASLKIRTWGKKTLLHREKQMILETRKGTRLLGVYSPQSEENHRGLVIFASRVGGKLAFNLYGNLWQLPF